METCNFLFSPRTLGKIPILTNIFQMGWNHQLVVWDLKKQKPPMFFLFSSHHGIHGSDRSVRKIYCESHDGSMGRVWYIYLHWYHKNQLNVGKHSVRPRDPMGINNIFGIQSASANFAGRPVVFFFAISPDISPSNLWKYRFIVEWGSHIKMF